MGPGMLPKAFGNHERAEAYHEDYRSRAFHCVLLVCCADLTSGSSDLGLIHEGKRA